MLFNLFPLGFIGSSFIVGPGVHYIVTNGASPDTWYQTDRDLDFNNITLKTAWVSFNSIGFNMSGNNAMNLTLSQITSSPRTPGSSHHIISFNVSAVAGTFAKIYISSLVPQHWYRLYNITGAANHYIRTNQTGKLRWNLTGGMFGAHGTWSYRLYDFINSPNITINFAGNLTQKGGPYWRPPGESVALSRTGYFTNSSYQYGRYMNLNVTVNGTATSSPIHSVFLHWYNQTSNSWANATGFVRSGGYWTLNTSGFLVVHSGNWYSFDIWANDTNNNWKITPWNKTGEKLGSYVRRFVSLKNERINITHTPFYIFDTSQNAGEFGEDRLKYDGGTDGSTDSFGIFNKSTPTNTVEFSECALNIGFWFGNRSCVLPFHLQNIYFHMWLSSDDGDIDTVGYKKTRNTFTFFDPYNNSFNPTTHDYRSNITYNNGMVTYSDNYHLVTKKLITTPAYFTDNSIYECLVGVSENQDPTLISNRSFNSFVILNVPPNATLNASASSDSDGLSDWTELYRTYTNPFLVDTDNDGWSDYAEFNYSTDPNNFTDEPGSIAPVLTEVPTNGSVGVVLQPMCNVTIVCPSSTCNISFWDNTTGVWVKRQTNHSIASGGTARWKYTGAAVNLQSYHWRVFVNNTGAPSGIIKWTNKTYHFSTLSSHPIVVTTLNATGISYTNATLRASLVDSESVNVSCWFQYGENNLGNSTSVGFFLANASFSYNGTFNPGKFIKFRGFASSQSTLKENYLDNDTVQTFYGVYWFSQTFTPSDNHHITSVKLRLFRGGAIGLPGIITVGIRATDGAGKPVGVDLTSGTTDGNTLTTNMDGKWREVLLPAYQLFVGTKYAIVVRAPAGDVNNYLRWWLDVTLPTYAGGSFVWSDISGVGWTVFVDKDLMFKEYESETTVGLNKTFLTKPYAPTAVTVTATGSGHTVSWTKGTGANNTIVRRSTTTYPTSITDGTSVYNGTKSYVVNLSLTVGTKYYYSLWSYTEWLPLHQTSSNYTSIDQIMITTPNVTTNTSTGTNSTNSTLRGFLNDLGGSNIPSYGFKYGETTSYGSWLTNNTPSGWFNQTTYKVGDYRYVYSGFTEYGIPGASVLTGTPSKLIVRLAKVGSPTGYLVARVKWSSNSTIYETSRDILDVSTLSTTTFRWVSFNFSRDKMIMHASVVYGLYYTGGDSSNKVAVSYEAAGMTSYFKYLTANITRDPFNRDFSGFSPGTYYHYKAFANNSNGTAYGTDKTFLTRPLAPILFTVTTELNSSRLEWTNPPVGTAVNRSVMIRYRNDTYPTSITDGFLVVNKTSVDDTDYYVYNGILKKYFSIWTYAWINPHAWSWGHADGFGSSGGAYNITIRYENYTQGFVNLSKFGPHTLYVYSANMTNYMRIYGYTTSGDIKLNLSRGSVRHQLTRGYLAINFSMDPYQVEFRWNDSTAMGTTITTEKFYGYSTRNVSTHSTTQKFYGYQIRNRTYKSATEKFYGYSYAQNLTYTYVQLTHDPSNKSVTNVTCFNASGSGTSRKSYPSFVLSGDVITIYPYAAKGFTQVNVTYTYTITNSSFSQNSTTTIVQLDHSPINKSQVNVTCYNAVEKRKSYPLFLLSTDIITIYPGMADEFTQINVTYVYSTIGSILSQNMSYTYIQLDKTPVSYSSVNITCYNAIIKHSSYPAFTLSGSVITINPNTADEFTQINVTYTYGYGTSIYRCNRMIVPENDNFSIWIVTNKLVFGDSTYTFNNTIVQWVYNFIDNTGIFLNRPGIDTYAYIYTYSPNGSRMVIHSQFLDSYKKIYPWLLYGVTYYIGITSSVGAVDRICFAPTSTDSSKSTSVYILIDINTTVSIPSYTIRSSFSGGATGLYVYYSDAFLSVISSHIRIYDYLNESLMYTGSSTASVKNYTFAGALHNRSYIIDLVINSSNSNFGFSYNIYLVPGIAARWSYAIINATFNTIFGYTPFRKYDNTGGKLGRAIVPWVDIIVFVVFCLIIFSISGYNAILSGMAGGGWMVFAGAMISGSPAIFIIVGIIILVMSFLYAWGGRY